MKNIGKKLLGIFGAVHRANVAEIEEIKSIVPTDEDIVQADALASIAVAAMASMGVPALAIQSMIIKKVIAYGLRDIKNGVKSPKDLLLSRIVHELKNINQ